MTTLGFQLIFAGSADPSFKMKRSQQQATAIQNKWDARQQRRRLAQEVNSSDVQQNCKKI